MDEQTARATLGRLSEQYASAESQLEKARAELSQAIADVLMARALGPSEVTRLVPFERQHVGRIAKAAGVPPLRAPTVSRITKTADGK